MATLENLRLRASLIKAVRDFFYTRAYLEVETPCRIPAPMPEATIAPVSSEGWFLQTSPEVCMKRLLAAGMPRIFQICHTFRRSERGGRHLPEFTMLEWYGRGNDYLDLMAETEDLLRFAANTTGNGEALPYQGQIIDLSPGWPKMTVAEAFDCFATIPISAAITQNRFDEIMGTEIEPRLGWDRPVFLCDYPTSQGAAFARIKPGNAEVVERFELYIGGLELCNGFSELTGAAAYRERFEKEQQNSATSLPVPKKFLEEIAEMPAAAGNALGVDRLVMLFCDAAAIDEVVAFTPELL